MAGKLFRAPFPHRFRQVAVEVGEKEERMRFAILLAHKQQRNMGRQEQRREQHARFIRPSQRDKPLPLGTVADLVVILNKIDKKLWGLLATLYPARFSGLKRDFPLVDKAFCQRPRQFFLRLKGKILIVGV